MTAALCERMMAALHCRWNRMDVAVKVIEHDGSSYAAVEEEMDMMMSFNHPNIVRCAGNPAVPVIAVLSG